MKTRIKTKILSGLLGLVGLITLNGCDIGMPGGSKIFEWPEGPGIYECNPKEGFIGPTYQFDSDEVRIWMNSGKAEFTDLISGKKFVYTTEQTLQYDCHCIKSYKR